MSHGEEFFKDSFLDVRPIFFEGSSSTAFMEASSNVNDMIITWPMPFITITDYNVIVEESHSSM